MKPKPKKPKQPKPPKTVTITQGQADILNGMTARAKAIESETATAVATIAAGAGIAKWGNVNLDGLTLTFGEPQEAP